MGRSSTARALIGFVAIVALGIVGFFGTRFAQGAFAPDLRFTVNIGETGQGLITGSDVTARGVLIGRVGQINLNNDLEAEVQLIIEPQYQIPEDSTFAVLGKTLFGEKVVEINFEGDPANASSFIADGDVIGPGDGRVVEVQDVLEDLNDLFVAINPDDLAVVINDGLGAFVGQEDAIGRAVDQGVRATDVLERSLPDQTPTLRDLSLVAEALGPVGDEFNRLGSLLDGGALDTITANQARLRLLLDELNAFADQLDLILRLTRPDLDRLILEGDNVTRMLFAYRPELGEVLVGLSEYTDLIGNGGITDPGWTGIGAGFQIIITNPFAGFCDEAPPELVGAIPACAGTAQAPAQLEVPAPAPVLQVPAVVDAAPQPAPIGGLEVLLEGVTRGLNLEEFQGERGAR